MAFFILDFDDTYTAAPVLWDNFIKEAQSQGHTVVCCTMRPAHSKHFGRNVSLYLGQHNVPIVYAALYKDKWEAMTEAGYDCENAIWIDDRPQYIWIDRSIDELEKV